MRFPSIITRTWARVSEPRVLSVIAAIIYAPRGRWHVSPGLPRSPAPPPDPDRLRPHTLPRVWGRTRI